MIKPTIGRVVWFWPSPECHSQLSLAYSDKTMPLSARVAYVWSDRMVNLAFEDQNGRPFNITSVLLLQGDEEYQPVGSYCEWMPYQKGQAAKVEDHAKPILRDGSPADPEKFGVITIDAGSMPVEPSLTPFGFGGALNVMRLGGRVARKGWNGKGMWVTMAGPEGGSTVNHEKFWSPNNAKFAKDQPDGAVTVNPYFTIKNTDNTISNWVPSTGDILALDWVTVQ